MIVSLMTYLSEILLDILLYTSVWPLLLDHPHVYVKFCVMLIIDIFELEEDLCEGGHEQPPLDELPQLHQRYDASTQQNLRLIFLDMVHSM